jgi:hypothetical protein
MRDVAVTAFQRETIAAPFSELEDRRRGDQ